MVSLKWGIFLILIYLILNPFSTSKTFINVEALFCNRSNVDEWPIVPGMGDTEPEAQCRCNNTLGISPVTSFCGPFLSTLSYGQTIDNWWVQDDGGLAADAEAKAYFDTFARVLWQNNDCDPSLVRYSSWGCDHCQDAYKAWICSIYFVPCTEDGTNSTMNNQPVVKPCLDVCYDVARKCPSSVQFSCPRYFNRDYGDHERTQDCWVPGGGILSGISEAEGIQRSSASTYYPNIIIQILSSILLLYIYIY